MEEEMYLTATQFKNNFGEYMELASKEDIYVTKNNKIIAKVSNPFADRVQIAESLFGILPNDIDLEKSREERLAGI